MATLTRRLPLGDAADLPSVRTCRPAFTRVELLTVIGIIAGLAAVLIPVFAQVRESARRTNCLSNLATLAHLDFQEVVAQETVTDERVSVQLDDFRIPRLVDPIEDDSVHGTTPKRTVRKEDRVIARVLGVQVSD
jgi:type II secretory pathway pseudopilin PulG